MNSFKKHFSNTNAKPAAARRVRRYTLAAAAVMLTGMLIFTVQAQSPAPFRFDLVPASTTISACLPDATATVIVFPKDDIRGVDTMDLKAEGLLPDTKFTVFLTELAEGPFGAVEYIGEFTTNATGRGSVRMDATIDDAFSSAVVGSNRVRTELNHIVLWFADPAADDACFAPQTGPITPFDGDGQAGASVLSSRNFLPNAPLP